MTEYKGTTHTIMDLLERNKREKIKNVPRPEDGPRTNIKNTARPGDADPKSEKSLLPKEDEIRTKVIDETKIAQSKSKPEDLKKPKKLEIGDVGKQPPTQVIINPELDRNNLGENKSLNEGDVTVQYQLNNGKWISARSCPRSPAEILMAMQAVQETFRFNRVRVVDESGNLVDIASNVPLSLTGGPRDVVTGRDVNETKKPGLIIKTIAMLAGQDHPLGRYAIYKIGKYEADEAQDRADKRNKEMVDAIRGKKERNEETILENGEKRYRVFVKVKDPATLAHHSLQMKTLKTSAQSHDHAKEKASSFYKKKGYKNINPYSTEELKEETLDELKPATLKSYKEKSEKSERKNNARADALVDPTGGGKHLYDKKYQKVARKAGNREEGQEKAEDRLSGFRWKKKDHPRGYRYRVSYNAEETLDEISDKVVKSYYKKRSKQVNALIDKDENMYDLNDKELRTINKADKPNGGCHQRKERTQRRDSR